ncbi:hypothetical protein CXB51_004528 [Gossypium anomalum]|uniref:Integrase catalytic domain-containing protein n=1 Tax=Gossypium anomalum TaxID=47600 RepID=A0A8J5ZG68_9ROSI|nr:hypothetical protein CXB51_004528 [Gossypium anomalum]
MASLKYEIPLLDCNTIFALWQIKMQAVLAQMDLEDALLGIDKMPSNLTDEEKKRKDRKALTLLHLHLSNEILQDVMKEKTEGASVHEHLTMFKEILSNLEVIEVQYDKEDLGERVSLLMGDKIGMLIMIMEGHRNGIAINLRVDRSLQIEGKQPENSGEADVVEDYSDGELLIASINDSKVSEEWILDSDCTFHMSLNRDWFTTYETVFESVVLMGNNTSCKIAGVGTIKVKMFDGAGSTVTGDAAVASSSLSDDDITKLWHMSLGHMSENGMVELSKKGLLDGQGICKLNFCEHYIFGKKVWAFFLKQKSDVFSSFKSWKIMIEKQTGKQIKYLRTDNGLEFCSDEFNILCKLERIVRHLTVRHTPQ